jgi:hypothetical protein
VQSPTAAALLAQLHVGLEVAVNVLVANTGQVPLMLAPALAARVAIPVVTVVADETAVFTVALMVPTLIPVVPKAPSEFTAVTLNDETKTFATPAQP